MTRFAFCGLAAALTLTGGALAQQDPLYLTDGDGHRNFIVQNGSVQSVFGSVPSERAFGIAVAGDVRTYGYANPERGGGYDLAGNSNGNIYTYNAGSAIADGTTNGVDTNWAIDFFGTVYKYDRNWANGQQVWSAQGYGGITYDPTDNTLWLSADRSAGIAHYDLNGNPLGGFNTVGGLDWDLAYEPTSNSLWVSQAFNGPNTTLYNYDKNGTLIQSFSVPGLGAASFFGGEFEIGRVPAPGAAALMGLGGLVASRRRRA